MMLIILAHDYMPNYISGSTEDWCAICQDPLVHPIYLPCGHRFCYLCIKGVYARRGTCALCRQHIPASYIEKPSLQDNLHSDTPITTTTTTSMPTSVTGQQRWLYEARSGGWWQYEERVMVEIEQAYKNKQSSVKVSISGFSYEVDFERMVQYRVDRPERYRRVKREEFGERDIVKGVAGITFSNRPNSQSPTAPSDCDREN